MCKYCHSDKVLSDFDNDKIDSWDAVEHSILDYDETGEGNSFIMLFGDGVLYDFVIPEQIKRLPFNYCPMCGRKLSDDADVEDKPLYSSDEPINEPEYYYLVRDDCGEFSIYDNERMAKELAEEVATNVSVAELLRVKVDAINTCEVRCCWDDEK